MNTMEMFYIMCDGNNSIRDIKNILIATGHAEQDVMRALTAVVTDDTMVATASRENVLYSPRTSA